MKTGGSSRARTSLLAVGSIPNSEGIDLDVAGVEVDERGYVRVNHNCLSNVGHIYAAGDVSGKLPLSSVAAMQGRKIAEHLMGLHNRPHRHLDYDKAASAVFTDPEIADVGLAEAEAFSEGRKIRVTKVPYSANAKALIKGDARGFVKILSDPATGVVLGGSIVGRQRGRADQRARGRGHQRPASRRHRRLVARAPVARRVARGRGVVTDDFLLFAGSASRRLGAAIAEYLECPLGESETIRFSEGNLFVRVLENVRGRHTFLMQGTAFPANDNFMELLFWIDALKRASAESVTAVIPYFSYAKGDKKDEPWVSIRARVCADAIEAAGVDHRPESISILFE